MLKRVQRFIRTHTQETGEAIQYGEKNEIY